MNLYVIFSFQLYSKSNKNYEELWKWKKSDPTSFFKKDVYFCTLRKKAVNQLVFHQIIQSGPYQITGVIIKHGHICWHTKTRPSSDSEAATMYKLKGQSSNMRTGQGFKQKRAGPSSWSVKLVYPAGLSSRPVWLICLANSSSWFVQWLYAYFNIHIIMSKVHMLQSVHVVKCTCCKVHVLQCAHLVTLI